MKLSIVTIELCRAVSGEGRGLAHAGRIVRREFCGGSLKREKRGKGPTVLIQIHCPRPLYRLLKKQGLRRYPPAEAPREALLELAERYGIDPKDIQKATRARKQKGGNK